MENSTEYSGMTVLDEIGGDGKSENGSHEAQ